MQKRWSSINTQDGSGGGGAGGGILMYGGSIKLGSNRIRSQGGICGAQDGGHPQEQVGGPGANGRVVAVSNDVGGVATNLLKRRPF